MSERILVNLPPAFHRCPSLAPCLARLRLLGDVRLTSHNTPEEIAPDLHWATSVIMWAWPALDEKLLADAPSLRYIGHIDVSQSVARAELARGVAVSLSKGGWSPAVAEMALALTLAALRRTSTFHSQMWNGTETWATALDLPEVSSPLERELTQLPVGIVGLGMVGRRLAELLKPFRVTLRVVDPFVPRPAIEAAGGIATEIDTLIAESDVVILCAAANAGTERLFNSRRIEALRPGAVFVNVARAALVDSEALLQRLRKGDLFAALDVFDVEPLPQESEFRKLPNVYLTPHRSGGLHSSIFRTVSWLVDDLEAFLADRPRRYALTAERLPSLDA